MSYNLLKQVKLHHKIVITDYTTVFNITSQDRSIYLRKLMTNLAPESIAISELLQKENKNQSVENKNNVPSRHLKTLCLLCLLDNGVHVTD